MRILSCMFGIGRGGIENVFLDYEKTFVDLGYESHVIANSKFKDLNKITSENLYLTKHNKIMSPLSYYYILKYINKINPDIIFMHGNRAISLVCNKIIKLFIKNKNVKFVATTHNIRNKRFINLDYSIAISEFLKQELLKSGISKESIFKCSNTTNLRPEITEFKYKSPIIIGSIGRLHTVKGYDLLIQSFVNLLKEDINVKLIIAGSGPEEEKLKNLIKKLNIENHAQILPWVENIETFFNKIDIFCLSSRSEAFGLSLIEAMSFSKPCVATRHPGVEEIFSHNNSGIIVEKANIDELTKGLKKLIQNEDLAKDLSKKSYNTIKDFYSKEVLKNNLKNIVETIISKK